MAYNYVWSVKSQRLGETCRLQLQGRRISQTKYKGEKWLQAGLFLGFSFDPEDGGDMFHRNVRSVSRDYMVSFSRRHNSSPLKLFNIHSESIQLTYEAIWLETGIFRCLVNVSYIELKRICETG
jgi:hypothetical protein